LSAQAGGKGPGIHKVVLPEELFQMAVERGRETPTEVAFFMVGLVRGGVAYVYDLVEFDYEEKSLVLVCSGTERKLRLVGALPIGLRLIGNMHKHPGTASPSWMDREMFLKYARGGGQHAFVIYTVRPVEARAFTVRDERVVEIDCEIRALREEEKLSSIRLKVPLDVRVCFPRGVSLLELRLLLAEGLCRELEKQVGLPRLFSGEEAISDVAELAGAGTADVRPHIPVDVEADWVDGLFYRFYVDEGMADEELLELVRKTLGPDADIVGREGGGSITLLRVRRKAICGGGALEGAADEGGDAGAHPRVPPHVLEGDMERLPGGRPHEEDGPRVRRRGPRGRRGGDIGSHGHREDNNRG